MTRKIVVAQQKGGVGKTTTAINLAFGLSKIGAKTLIIDTDTQGQISTGLQVAPQYGLAEYLLNEAGFDSSIYPARENLWIMAGGRSISIIKEKISIEPIAREKFLAKAMNKHDSQFDFVIVDSSPGWDLLTMNLFFYVDEVLMPVNLEVFTIHSVIEFLKRLDDINEYRPEIGINYVLPTFLDKRVKKGGEILNQLKKQFQEKVCHPIRYSVRLSECPGFGKTIWEYAPKSSGAEDYEKLIMRVVNG